MSHHLPPEKLWLLPLLEWYHGMLARVSDGDAAHLHRGRAAMMRMARVNDLRVSDHCIDRFCERWRPNASRNEARATLLEILCTAKPLGEPAWWAQGGADPWMAGPLRLIVRDNKTIVTILPMEPQ